MLFRSHGGLLAPHLPADQQPAMLARALTAAAAIRDDSARAQALTALAPHLPPDLLARALTTATAIPNDYYRAQALTGLAPHLPPDLLGEALDATPKMSGVTFAALLQRSRLLPSRDEEAAYLDLLRKSINGPGRGVCLYLITETVPAIAEIGGVRSIEQCVSAVIDVHRWWP